MSEAQQHHHHYDAEVAVHDAQGNIKLRVEAEDHLSRLLAPDTEIPWYKSIYENIQELIKPEKLPPLELTSKPVAVKAMVKPAKKPVPKLMTLTPVRPATIKAPKPAAARKPAATVSAPAARPAAPPPVPAPQSDIPI